ncbi:uncharacterized protein LOC130710811 [Lotus japonicus]|uniref:uncharacterized protein LOC130710811 n=1 Tax=Lotus japonicus TaxID=34305 RepID=UPI00258A77AE|nr:uncharacterized protein LOC130710811 [Lotus japonicus]
MQRKDEVDELQEDEDEDGRRTSSKSGNNTVLVEPNVEIILKLRTVEPYVTYGYPNLETIKELLYNKGHANIDNRKVPLTDDIIEQELGKFGIVCMDDMVHQIDNVGPHLNKVVRFMWPFELNKPSGVLKGLKTPGNR